MLFTERTNGLCKVDIYIYCNIPVPKRDTVCRIKPASVNQALQKKKKTKLTGIGAGEITEEYWFMYT